MPSEPETPTTEAPTTESPLEVSGYIVNGPLDGATVSVYSLEGVLIGKAMTNAEGFYQVDVSAPPPYRIEVEGGLLDGKPYTGVLEAPCVTAVRCNATPVTTAVSLLMREGGYNRDEAMAKVNSRTGMDYDPFLRVYVDKKPAPEFDLASAREYIHGGDELAAWVEDLVEWATQPIEKQHVPAGVVYRHTVTTSVGTGTGGAFNVARKTVVHGKSTSFIVTPATGYSIASVTGCGGTLVGNTFTTGTITAACMVTAHFETTSYTVSIEAGVGGTVDPSSSQTVQHGEAVSFGVTPAKGFAVDKVDGCGGSLNAGTYTASHIVGDCTITASFRVDLAAPQNVRASKGEGQVTLSWDPVEDAQSYDITYATETFDPDNPAVAKGFDVEPDVAASPFTINNLINGAKYHFAINGNTATGHLDGASSSLISATPQLSGPVCYGKKASDPTVCSGRGVCSSNNTCDCAFGLVTGRECDVELRFANGETSYTWPTNVDRHSIIQGPALPVDRDDVYTWTFKIVADGYHPARNGMSFGLASYPQIYPIAHELGMYADEWAYSGRDGLRRHVDTAHFGTALRTQGEYVKFEYYTRTGRVNVYTKRLGESTFSLEANEPLFEEGVAPPEGRLLHIAVSAMAWKTVTVEFVE
ncbi:fibronectin type III domain-containing protein [Marinobacter nanhaiticus]|nr:fibronectin type III domain-containing protein [Marinobacter nanhaiticus]